MNQYVFLEETDSTNREVARRAAELAHGAVIVARSQTAGRGQRGNGWESAPGLNLTLSMMLRPRGIEAKEAFVLSMLTSLAVADVLRTFLPDEDIKVKWPNDIYVGDLKICGILHENSLSGACVAHSIAGIGVNVNQTRFVSDAPNPVSMAMLAGHEFDLGEVLTAVCSGLLERIDSYSGDASSLVAEYQSHLWRGTGSHLWHDHLRHENVYAAIAAVAPDGSLTLDTDPPRTFLFKELSPADRHRFGGGS